MKKKRMTAALLLVFMLAGNLASCGESAAPDAGNDTTVTPTGTTAPEEETEPAEINRENAVSSLKGVDLGGETINILYTGETTYAQDVFAEQTGDLVDDAVYNRNIYVEDTLNVKLNPITAAVGTQDTADHLAKTVLAGEDEYDLASVHQAYSMKYVTEGYFHNFVGDKYIDFEKPWWNLDYMKEMTVGDDRVFFLVGDISLMYLKSLGCIYYNRDLYETIYGNADEPYDLVFSGKWTFDKYSELVRGAYADLNGDGQVNVGDRFGGYGSKGKSVEHYVYGAGIRSTTKNAEGIPELTLYNETTVAFAEALHDLYFDNIGFRIASADDFKKEMQMFADGSVLFAQTWFRHAEIFRDMDNDYGIVCMPKFLESSDYTTLVHDGTTVFATPITSQKTDIVGAVCEAMAFQNYKTVTPAYYEIALKVKYSRDDKTAQMLDLINASATTNFGYVYFASIAGVPSLRAFVNVGANDFTSWYKKNEEKAIAGLEKVIAAYKD